MSRTQAVRAALLSALGLVLVPMALGQCIRTTPEDQYCCLGTAHCLAHCVVITGCDDNYDIGLNFCSTSGGLCCDDPYDIDRASGDYCNDRPPYKRRAVRVESEGRVFDEAL